MGQAVFDTAALVDFGGELLRDGDPGYDESRRVFNAAIDRRPALIAHCSGVVGGGVAEGVPRLHGGRPGRDLRRLRDPVRPARGVWDYHLLGPWADAAEAETNIEWPRSFDAAMAPFAKPGVYVNFVGDRSPSAVVAGFGSEKYTRLVAVKEE